MDLADERGKLRTILDGIRSHRVVDDLSSRWSYAREDFERRLYHKRAKARVTFVELDKTIPCHGPEAEVDADLLWEDFFRRPERQGATDRRVLAQRGHPGG